MALTSLARETGGATAVEFALIGPALIAIVMGVVEFASILHSQSVAQNAARSMVRQLSMNRLTIGEAHSRGLSDLPSWVVKSAKVSVRQSAPQDPDNNQITVDISFPATAASPTGFFSSLYKKTTVHGEATMSQEAPL